MNSPERIADAGMFTSFFFWLVGRALEWMPILQAASFIVAIVAGTLAVTVHLVKLYDRFFGTKQKDTQ